MKALLVAFVFLSTQAFAETIKIAVGDSEVTSKLTSIGASPMGDCIQVIPQPRKEDVWALSDSSYVVEVWLDKGHVTGICFWRKSDSSVRIKKKGAADGYAKSISFDTEKKTIQVEEKKKEANQQPDPTRMDACSAI